MNAILASELVSMANIAEAPTNLQVLRASTLLNSLNEDQVSELAGKSHMAFAERGSIIWLDGSNVDFFGVVGVGFIKMTRSTSAGQAVTTEIMGPGHVFGLLGVIDGHGCPQTAQTVCNTWYLKVSKRSFLEVYKENVVLKEHLLRRTSNRLRTSFDMLAKMSTMRVEQRIAAILFMLAESYGTQNGEALLIEVPLTRQDLAEMAGTTVETAIRVMSAWQKQGLVTTKQKNVVIRKPEILAQLL